MTRDETPFETELRTVLDDLAADAAPNRLVAEVAAIPAGPSARANLRVRPAIGRALAGFATAAVLLAAVGALIVSRPAQVGGQPDGATGPSAATPTSSAAAVVPGSAAASPSVPLTTSPAPSTVTGGPVPVGFRAAAATFVSPDRGWVLGTAPCASAPCTSVLRTTDGGRTWEGIPAPPTALAPSGQVDISGSGVSSLRFADPLDGWAYGPELWSTHDGGATWHRVAIDGLPANAAIEALGSANGTVHLVVQDAESAHYRIASSPIGSDDWRLATTQIPIGAGPVPQVQLVLSGSAGWLIEVDRTVVGGARLVGGRWEAWRPPCLDLVGPAVLAAADPTELVAACDVGLWGDPKGVHLYRSNDGGLAFVEAGGSVPVSGIQSVAAMSDGVAVIAGDDDQGAALIATFDGGKTWTTVARLGAVTFTDLGFTTASQGIALTWSADEGGRLFMTHDGGHTWSAIAFGAP